MLRLFIDSFFMRITEYAEHMPLFGYRFEDRAKALVDASNRDHATAIMQSPNRPKVSTR